MNQATAAATAFAVVVAGCAAAPHPAPRPGAYYGCTERTGPLPSDVLDRRGELCDKLRAQKSPPQ